MAVYTGFLIRLPEEEVSGAPRGGVLRQVVPSRDPRAIGINHRPADANILSLGIHYSA